MLAGSQIANTLAWKVLHELGSFIELFMVGLPKKMPDPTFSSILDPPVDTETWISLMTVFPPAFPCRDSYLQSLKFYARKSPYSNNYYGILNALSGISRRNVSRAVVGVVFMALVVAMHYVSDFKSVC